MSDSTTEESESPPQESRRRSSSRSRDDNFLRALGVWLKIGLLGFGGPIGQIALMHRELVERRGWLDDSHFKRALQFCMLLPGPEAQQLATYTGWLLHGRRGGLAAGILFVLPGALLMLAICMAYMKWGTMPEVEAVFRGLQAVVLAVVFSACLHMAARLVGSWVGTSVAVIAFAASFARIPFPFIVLGALLVGFGFALYQAFTSRGRKTETAATAAASSSRRRKPTLKRTFATILFWGALWIAPLAGCILLLGPEHILSRQAVFFAKAAWVSFGGAYAVLQYVSQEAVQVYQWLEPAQMMDGLALAETTPGPLILVLQFVGFLAGWAEPGNLPPWAMATAASAITLWMIFVPAFLFIFAGAPWVEKARGCQRFETILAPVGSAVTGVLLALALWFGYHVLVAESGPFPIRIWEASLAVLAFFLMRRSRWGVVPVLFLAGALSVLHHLATL
jgi:chromate transporter